MSGYIGVQPVPQATQRREYFTATNGQATFNTNGYTPNYIDVYMNGVKLSPADFTASNGSDVVLASGATTGDLIQVVSFTPFNVANQTFIGDVNLSSGAYKIGGNTAINSSRAGSLTSLALTGNATFGDNNKAIFGAGSDLQIYHNPTGSHSYITESGGGSLYIQGTELNLTNAAGTSTYANFVDGGAAFIRHAGATKLATSALGVDIKNTSDPVIKIQRGTGSYSEISSDSNGTLFLRADEGNTTSSSNIRFEVDNTEHMRLDEYGQLILQSNPSTFFLGGSSTGSLVKGTSTGNYLIFGTSGSEVARFVGSNLGIGTTSPTAVSGTTVLEITGTSGNAGAEVIIGSSDQGATAADLFGGLAFKSIDNNGTPPHYSGIKARAADTYGGANLEFYAGRSNYESNDPRFVIEGPQSVSGEAMRLTSDGNLLVGTTDSLIWNEAATDNSKEGVVIEPKSLQISRYQDTQALFNRQGNDGTNMVFAKDGSPHGYIASINGDIAVGTGTTSLRFYDGTSAVLPTGTHGAQRSDAISLGDTNNRFKDLYLSGSIYLGGTGSANRLDGYEEGTFTPTVTGSSTAGTTTYNAQQGYYTKIGRLVNISCIVNYSAMTGSGFMELKGIPYGIASLSGSQNYPVGTVLPSAINWTGGTTLVGLGLHGTSIIALYGSSDDGGATRQNCVNESANFRLTMSYMTT